MTAPDIIVALWQLSDLQLECTGCRLSLAARDHGTSIFLCFGHQSSRISTLLRIACDFALLFFRIFATHSGISFWAYMGVQAVRTHGDLHHQQDHCLEPDTRNSDLQDFKISLMISFTNHKIPNIPAMNLWLTLAMMIADLSYPDDLQYDSKSLTCCHCTLGVSRCNFLVSNFQI